MLYVLLASVLTTRLPDAIAALVAVTALFGSAARYAAVLAGREESELERATAFGFFFGFALGLLGLLVDYMA